LDFLGDLRLEMKAEFLVEVALQLFAGEQPL
jgi:hypothetical protein